MKLGLPKNNFTFHTFRQSGATLAYKLEVSVQHIKDHGSWASDCVWTYIHKDHTAAEHIANVFAQGSRKQFLVGGARTILH